MRVYYPWLLWQYLFAVTIVFTGSCTGHLTSCIAQAPRGSNAYSLSHEKSSPELLLRSVHITDADLRDFGSAFSALTNQGDFAVIAEGVPLNYTLSEKAKMSLWQELTEQQEGSLDKQIATIAKAFDYEPERLGSHLVVLKKRYTDPRDLPFITFEEARFSLDEMARSIRSVLPGEPAYGEPDSPLHLLMGSISLDQQEVIKKTGIPVSQLRADQRVLLRRYDMQMYQSGDIEEILHVAHEMDAMKERRAAFGWIDWKSDGFMVNPSMLVFGYACPYYPDRAVINTALSHGFVVAGGGGMSLGYTRTEYKALPKAPDGRLIGPPTDLTAPTGAPPSPLVLPTCALYLQDFVARLNAMASPGTGNMTSVASSPAPNSQETPGQSLQKARRFHAEAGETIRSKPLCFFHIQDLPPESLLRAAASVYGLQVVQPQVGLFRIEPPRSHTVHTIDELSAEITRHVPEPFLRAISASRQVQEATIGEEQSVSNMRKVEPKRGTRGLPDDFFVKLEQLYATKSRRIRDERASAQMYNEAVRCLRATVEPQMSGKKAGVSLPFQNAGEAAQRFFALYCLARLAVDLDRIAIVPANPVLSYFDHSYVRINASSTAEEENITVDRGMIDGAGKFKVPGGTTFQLPRRSTP